MSKQIKYQTLVITQTGVRAANTTENYEIALDSQYNKVTGIEFLEETNTSTSDYQISVNSESENMEDFATRLHYLASAAGVLSDIPFNQRIKEYFFDAAGKKATIGIKNITALGGGDTIKLHVIFRLEK